MPAPFRRLFFSALCLWPWIGYGQNISSSYLPYDQDVYGWIDRAAILNGGGAGARLDAVRPYLRNDLAPLADSLARLPGRREQAVARFLQVDNSECFADSVTRSPKPLLKYFYTNPADLFSVREPAFDLHISPVFYGSTGLETDYVNGASGPNPTASDKTPGLYTNTRGIEVRGTIDRRVSFHTFFADNQVVLPRYQRQYANGPATTGVSYNIPAIYPALPQEAFVKPLGTYGYDFITARGHIALQATKHIAIALGQDRHFVGDGIRSLILSDHSPAMPFLGVDLNIWKIRYTNLFMQGKAGTRRIGDSFIPNKWITFHHLDIALRPNLHFSVFESIVFAPGDTNKRGLFDLSYLNPVIFYRFAEQYNGSADNSMVGAGGRWDVLHQFRLYGQFVLDELKLDNLRAQNGWWANKYALQAGLKWINPAGISGLDLQAEYNLVRPFTYTHRDKFRAYSNFGLPLAHPAGANFTEFVGKANYQLLPTLRLQGQAMLLRYGADSPTQNYGHDVLRSYDDRRVREFGNTIGQGTPVRVAMLQGTVSWMLRHRIFLEGTLIYRKQTSDLAALRTASTIAQLAIRWNIARREGWY